MKVYIGTDHAGYELKEKIKAYLQESGLEVVDKGAYTLVPEDDYPDYIIPVAEAVAADASSFGIVFGGSGQGEEMAANKIKGIRAAEYYGGATDIVILAREHNNANILSLGARFITEIEAKEAVKVFLETPFSNDPRHIRRINKL